MKLERLVTSRWIMILPFALSIILAASYISTQWLYMDCGYKRVVDCGTFSPAYLLDDTATAIDYPVVTATNYLRRGIGRVGVRFSSWTHVFAIIFATIAGLIIIARWFKVYGVVGCVVLSLLVMAAVSTLDKLPILTPLAGATVQQAHGGMTNFVQMSQWFNSLGYFATTMMVLTLCVLLYPTTAGAKQNVESLEILGEKRKHLSFVLYVMAVLLIVGMWRINTGYDWVRAFLPDANPDLLKDFLNAVQTQLGAFFSLLIAATYLPTAFILQKRAEIAFAIERPEEEASTGLTNLGFSFSMREAIPRILAIAGPFMSGGLLDVLGKALPK